MEFNACSWTADNKVYFLFLSRFLISSIFYPFFSFYIHFYFQFCSHLIFLALPQLSLTFHHYWQDHDLYFSIPLHSNFPNWSVPILHTLAFDINSHKIWLGVQCFASCYLFSSPMIKFFCFFFRPIKEGSNIFYNRYCPSIRAKNRFFSLRWLLLSSAILFLHTSIPFLVTSSDIIWSSPNT